MASATQSRGDDASRDEGVRLVEPKLEDLRISCVRPFTHIDEPEILLDQIYALTVVLTEAHRDAAAIGHRGIKTSDGDHASGILELSHNLWAEAIAGIGSLVALTSHSVEVLRHSTDQRWRSGQ